MSHNEQQLGEHEARLDNLERSAETQREEIREDLGHVNAKLDAIIAWQNEHHDVATLNTRVTSLEQSRDKLAGGWKAVVVVASAAATCGAGAAWLFENAGKIFSHIKGQP